MKFKIICVVIIAAALSAILGMALLQKDAPQAPAPTPPDAIAPSVNPGEAAAVTDPAPAPVPVPETTAATAAVPATETPTSTANVEPQPEMIDPSRIPRTDKELRIMMGDSKEKPPMLEAVLRNQVMFEGLDSAQKVVVLSSHLNMNEEQEVMLASYLEQWYAFQTENSGRAVQNIDPRRGGGPVLRGSASAPVPSVALDTKLAELEIAVQEIKEIRGLREKFYGALTKQQKEKFDALPIKSSF